MFMISKEDRVNVVSYLRKKGRNGGPVGSDSRQEGKVLLELQVNLISIQHSTEA